MIGDATLYRNIGQLLTMNPLAQNQKDAFAMIPRAFLIVDQGRVASIGSAHEEPSRWTGPVVDCGGCLISPGLVDAHTHLLYSGHRADEVAMRAKGKTYLEILNAGGGILSTVQKTRQASDEELTYLLQQRLACALQHGSTTVEVKTGYDLTVSGEYRMLQLLRSVQNTAPTRLVSTCLAAHAVPEEYRGQSAEYLAWLAQELLPKIGDLADFVDIFCEPGVFSVEESRSYLTAAQALGFKVKLHVDELADGHGAQLAAWLGAVSADHCAMTGQAGISAMAQAGTTAVLLPGTAGYLHHGGMPPARSMIEANLSVAIGSDGNPGSSPTEALSMLMPWAASWLNLLPEEVWAGVTIMGARALALDDRGALVPGKLADFVIWDTDDYCYPCYHYGVNLVKEVYVGGQRAM